MNFKDQLFHSSPLFSICNIFTFGNKILLENIIFVSKSISRQIYHTSLLYFMIGLYFQETYIGMKLAGLQLTILIFKHLGPRNMAVLLQELVLYALATIHKICQDGGYRKILKLSSRTLDFTSCNAFLNKKRSGTSPPVSISK